MKCHELQEEAKVYATIETAKELGADNATIISMLVKKFEFTKEEAVKKFEAESDN